MDNYSRTDDDLIDKTDRAIAELVYPKTELLKAYNYYNGFRDEELFRYLEDNFGIGSATSVEFTPLIRKHIDALVGEYLGVPKNPNITCKDEETISKITREKELYISNQVYKFLQERLQNKLLQYINKDGEDALTDDTIKQEMDKLVEDLDQSFVSSFECAAQDVLTYIKQSRTTDLITKLKLLLIDLLVTGYTFYKVLPTAGKQNVKIVCEDPLNTFVDRNPESPYVKDSYRAVVRHWMTVEQIKHEYGKDISKEDMKDLESRWKNSDNQYYYVRGIEGHGIPGSDGIRAGQEIIMPGYPTSNEGTNFSYDLIPVYEVEWIETDPKFVQHRQSTVRIADDVYILKEEDEGVVRSADDPNACTLSLNGVYFLNRNSKPYSLMLACMNLQDKYDMLIFYRDGLIASSGTTGYTLDISLLPKFLGANLPDRIMKHISYKKSGVNLIDTSQGGRMETGAAPMNTIFNDYDDSVKVQAVQAIQLAIQQVEQQASDITGVFRERLNGIEQRDAVTNIKQGVNNSYIITRQYYQQMDLVTDEILLDCLNVGKVVYKNGLQGTIILGDKGVRTFTALPESFTVTDHDLHVDSTTDTLQSLEVLKQQLPSLIQAGMLPPDLIIEMATSKNLPELKYKILKAMKKKEEENNQIVQLTQQTQELQNQLLEAQNQIKEYESQIKQADAQKMQLEKDKLKAQTDIDWYKALTDRQYKEATAETDKKRTEIEIMQLHDGNPYNDLIKDS